MGHASPGLSQGMHGPFLVTVGDVVCLRRAAARVDRVARGGMASGTPFGRLIFGFGGFGAAALVVDLFVLVGGLRSAAAVSAGIVALLLAAVALVTVMAMLITGRAYDQRIQRILGGAYLVHWRYERGEW